MFHFTRTAEIILVIVISLVFIVGVAAASVNFIGTVETDICCDHSPAEQPSPLSDAECSDPGCRCLSCSASLLELQSMTLKSEQDMPAPLWLLAANSPSDFISSIDYPPEHV